MSWKYLESPGISSFSWKCLIMSWNLVFTKKVFVYEWKNNFLTALYFFHAHSILSTGNSNFKLKYFCVYFYFSSYLPCYNQAILHEKSGITWESNRQKWNGWGQFCAILFQKLAYLCCWFLSTVKQFGQQYIAVRPKSKYSNFFSYHGRHYLIFLIVLNLLYISIFIFNIGCQSFQILLRNDSL